MLPYLASKMSKGGAMIASSPSKSDLEVKSEDNQGDSSKDLEIMAEDILRAIEAKSPIELARAFKMFMDVCESMPDEDDELEPKMACGGMM